INEALTSCLRLTVEKPGTRAGVANAGYWGIPVRPTTTYSASLYIKGAGQTPPTFRGPNNANNNAPALPTIENNTAGPITLSIESRDGKTVYASATVNVEKTPFWKKYSVKLT